MAHLHNEAKTLRLTLQLADRATLGPARVLGSAGIESLDRRDGEYWPLVRLPVVYFAPDDLPAVVESIRTLCANQSPGFGFRSDGDGDLALQLSRQGGALFVEAGFDLARVLAESAGRPGVPGTELALFRFQTATAELVQFADQLRRELEELRPARQR
jgi:hypothetical protein